MHQGGGKRMVIKGIYPKHDVFLPEHDVFNNTIKKHDISIKTLQIVRFWAPRYIVFSVLVYKQMLSFFEECIAPAQFPKNKDVSNTTLH